MARTPGSFPARTTLAISARTRRISAALLAAALALLGLGLTAAPAIAASQNEIVIAPLFDGTAAFTAVDAANPADGGGVAPATHTAGQDSGANNGVVRTYDLFAVRVDWDVNEAASTDTTLTVTLPDLPDADLAWAPDASGMFAGCGAGSSISADGLTLICKLGDVAEGTHGDIRPVAKLMRGTNNTTFNVTATISDSSGAAVDSDTLDRPFTVSEVGVGNWVKNDPIFTPTPVTNSSGAEGYVVLFPIGLKAADQASAPSKGSGPISTGGTISFQDHAWDMAAGSRLATAAEITAAAASGVNIFGSACGAYDSDNAGAMPGETAGTWSCTAPTSPNGYPVWTMSVNGYTNIAPDLNANGSANNAGYIITGQVIMWMDKAAVEDAMAPQGADFHNTISTDPVGTNVAANQAAGIAPIGIPVTSGTLPESTTKDNTTKFAIATGTSGGGGGGPGEYTSHYGLFTSSIKDILYYEGDPGVLETYPQPQTYPTGAGDSWRGRGTVSRGTPIQMNLNVSTGSESTEGPLYGCMRWDPNQIFLKPMADKPFDVYPVDQVLVTSTGATPVSDYFGDLLYGDASGSQWFTTYHAPLIIDLPEEIRSQLKVHVEYGYDLGTTPTDTKTWDITGNVAQNANECNNTTSRVWVDSKDTAGLEARAVGNGSYAFSMVRVRIEGDFPWHRSSTLEGPGYLTNGATAGFFLTVQGVIGSDIDINADGTEVYMHTSRASGAWDATAATSQPSGTSCHPLSYTDDVTLESPATTTGWCNQAYAIANENTSGSVWTTLDQANFTYPPGAATYGWDSDSDRVTIVVVRPAINKTNVAGMFDIKDNGQFVTFDLDVGAYGATTEALTNAVMWDYLPPEYHFVSLDIPPTTPGATCDLPDVGASNLWFSCRFSEADPAVDTGALPAALPGGWTDKIRITVQVLGGVSSSTTYAPLTNYATLESQGVVPWDAANNVPNGTASSLFQSADDTAQSFMPLPSDRGAIVKAVDAELGPCTDHPDGVLTGDALAAWQARCSLINLDPDAGNAPVVDAAGNMHFSLNYTNQGNTVLTNMRIVDVLPFNGDGTSEPGSDSAADGADPSTVGDARTPATNYHGDLGLISVTGARSYWVSADAPATISRDPNKAVDETTWCDAVAGTVVSGPAGTCPATAFDVTAVYLVMPDVRPDATVTAKVNLDTESAQCDDIWTNTFGARVNEINLPIRSNDVSIMTGCQSVGDFAWLDNNRNGLQDNNEPPMAGVTVNLLDASGAVVATTTTDADGYYSFQGLALSTTYSIEFVKPAGYGLTLQDASGVTSNDPVADNTTEPLVGTAADAATHGDSDVDPSTGRVTFTTTNVAGDNLVSSLADQTVADNPGFDAGFVQFNLVLDKELTTAGPFTRGQSVTFTLTPKNEGPSDALAGWSVTDVPPTGLTVTAIEGDGYTCDLGTLTCTSDAVLAAGASGQPITVTATIDPTVANSTTLKNVAYVSPSGDDVPETNPLGTPLPTTDTDTDASPTDNDDFAELTLANIVSVGDYVWLDTNRDGQQGDTTSEPPVADVTVNLYDAQGNLVKTTTTDANGFYSFTDLAASTEYTIEFVKPDGTTFTGQNIGADGTDSDANPADGKVTITTPATGNNSATTPDDPTIDAGLVELVSVGDYVWFDTNQDGQQGDTTSEPPVEGVAVNLYDADGNFVKSTTTDANGFYSFTDLLAGADYTIEFVKPDGSVFTSQNTGADATDSDANPADGKVAITAPTTGTNSATTPDDPTIDAGLIKLVSVGDYVWFDANRDGQQGDKTSEPPVEGVTVNLYDAQGNLVKTTTTDANGFYSFTDLAASTEYTIEFVKPDGTVFTSQDTGADATDSDANPADGKVTFTSPATGNNSATTPDDPTIDAGLIELVSVGDYVWFDTNLDGQQGDPTTEAPVADVTVNLYDAAGNLVKTTTTDANGFYSFTDLLAGADYTIEFVKPDGTRFTSQDTGADATDSDANPADGKVAITAPTTGNNSATTPDDPTIDAGLVELVSVGDYVWLDTNRDGQQGDTTSEPPVEGVTVNLYDAAGNLVKTTTTDANGFYSFTDLAASTEYTIEFVKPDGTTFTGQNIGADATDSDAGTDGKYTFTSPATGNNSATEPDDPTIDAGLIELVSVGDYVWLDTNRDGLQGDTTSEPPVADVTVNLYDAEGNLVKTTTTDANGFYSFTDLLAGADYTIEFVKPDGTVFTGQDAGDDATDSDANPADGKVAITAPATGENSATTPDDPTIDAGLIELVSVGDYVWLDTNRDGLQGDTTSEPPVEGVTVNLYDAEGNLVKTTTTDANGFYSFTDLLAGAEYTIEFVKPDGTVFTGQNAGDDATDSDAGTDGKYTFNAPATGNNSATEPDDPTIDAGLIELVSVGDYVWMDVDRDGQQDEGEAPVEGVTVNLYDAEGNLVKTTTTDANGFYSFTDLLAGADYTIEFVKPDGTVFTGQNAGDDATDSDANPADGKVAITAPATGSNSATQPDDPTIDAGLIELVSVGDYVWMDVDRDGQQDEGEAPVEGVTVNLYDAAGNLVKTTTTDANGFYSFTDLLAGAEYTIEFVKPDGTNFTGQNIGADGTDSDADFGTGKVTFTAPATGNNSATEPDDPTIDAGLVLFNLILDKKLVSSPRVQVGDNVTFTLTPHNEGPANALAGWSVTEVLPDGLELVSMTGDGYTCEGVTCTAADILAAGADGPVITVVAKVVAAGQQHNVAYVSPHKDDVPETNPLGPPPPPGTDTDGTDTDNDSQAEVGGWLAHTGLELGLLAGTGLGLVGIGGVLMLGRRRRPEAAGKHRIS